MNPCINCFFPAKITFADLQEDPEKWVGDQPFFPGFRYRDNQREGMAGTKFSPDLINAGDYKPPGGFSRDRHPEKEVISGAQH